MNSAFKAPDSGEMPERGAMSDNPTSRPGDWVDELVIDYGFDDLAYTYCPGTDDTCDHDTCIATKKCRKETDHAAE